LLAQGRNVLIHCAGGTGRTGMVVASVVKSVGVSNPVQWIRQVKSTYVETKQQEEFVASLPAIIDTRISSKYPTLSSVIALGMIEMSMKQHKMHHEPTNSSKKLPTTIEEIGLSPEQIQDYCGVFNLYDVDGSGSVTVEEFATILGKINSSASAEAIIKSVDVNSDGNISRFEFLLALSSVGN